MKNLFISLIIVCIVFTSFVSTASAEPTLEKRYNVISMIIKVTVRSKFSNKTTSKKYPFSFEKPVTTLLKSCVTDNGSSRICLYEVKGNKDIYIFDYNYSDIDDSIVVYEFSTTVSKR